MRNLMFVFDRMPDQDGCILVEVENESGESINAGEWRLRDDGLAELVVPVNYTAQSELAALREELAAIKTDLDKGDWKAEAIQRYAWLKEVSAQRDDLSQRLTAAEQRNATLEKLIAESPTVHIESCKFSGLNADGTEAFEFTGGTIGKIKALRMVGWVCYGPKPTESGASE